MLSEKRSWVMKIVSKTFILTVLIGLYQGFGLLWNRQRPLEDFIDDSFRDHVKDIADEIGRDSLKERAYVLPNPPDVDLQNRLPGLQHRYPKVIIIGAQKCGTGALKDYLRGNPFIYTAGEDHFFDRPNNYQKGYKYYLEMQPEISNNSITFDKSPSYMKDEIIPERIYKYYPKAKIICLLCEPSHRTLSHYLHIVALSKRYYNTPSMRRFYHRNITNELGTYNDAITTGINGLLKSNPKISDELNDTKNKFKNYAELRETIYTHLSDPDNYPTHKDDEFSKLHMEIVFRGAYAYYLQHYLTWFNRDQILILNANLLKTNPAKLLIETQEFMGVPIAVDEKNFVKNPETGYYCILGAEDLEPACTSPSKHRSSSIEISSDIEIKLRRFYKALMPDIENIAGKSLFSDWPLKDVF